MTAAILKFSLITALLSVTVGCVTPMSFQAKAEVPEYMPPMGLFASLTGCPPDSFTVMDSDKKIDVGWYYYYYKVRCRNETFHCSFYRGSGSFSSICHEAR